MAVVHLTVDELNDWLQAQPANTVDTPYEIDVTDLDYVYNDFVKILIDNPTKYVDLSPTNCNTTTNFYFFYIDREQWTMQGCSSLVVPPTINGLRMRGTLEGDLGCSFFGCTNLKKLVIEYIDYDQLLEDIENETGYLPDIFRHCDNLTTFEVDTPYEWKNILIALQERDAFDNNPANCTYRPFSEVVTVPFSDLNNELATWSANTAQTPYKLNVTGVKTTDLKLSSSTGSFGNILINNSLKFVDLSSTTVPDEIPSVYYIKLQASFQNCTSLVLPPEINTYNGHIVSLEATFADCTSLVSAPLIPDDITNMERTFENCASLTQSPIIPNGVLSIYRLFMGCSSLTTVTNVPSSITNLSETFKFCFSLEEITLFEADLDSLVANNKALSCFSGCTSLTKIGVPPSEQPAESDWHVYRLKFGASTVEGKVYDQTGTAVTIPQTTVTKATLELPIKTDELWFPSGLTDNEIDAIIEKVIQFRYTYWNKEVLDPAEKNFVLWADDPDNVKSNLKGMNPVDVVQSGNMNPVTSNAVANSNAMPVNSVTSGNMHSVTSGAVASVVSQLNSNISAINHQGVKYGNYDCNTMGEGLALINEDVANSPYKQGVVGSRIAYLLTMAIGTNISSYRIQLCLTYGSNILCVRGYTDSGWTNWTRIN